MVSWTFAFVQGAYIPSFLLFCFCLFHPLSSFTAMFDLCKRITILRIGGLRSDCPHLIAHPIKCTSSMCAVLDQLFVLL